MIWPCIKSEVPGPIYFVDGSMNAEQYEGVIKTGLLPCYMSLGSRRSQYTYHARWSTILLKRLVYNSPITTLSELETKMTNTWENNENIRDMIKQCILSMPERIQAVITAKGGNTRY
ncbi:hypothetical protein ANTRET_LOCUS4665 [Anthophora retusa]